MDLINGSELDITGRLVINGSAVANGNGMIEWENDRWLGHYTFGVEVGDGRRFAINSSTWIARMWERGDARVYRVISFLAWRVRAVIVLEDGRTVEPEITINGSVAGRGEVMVPVLPVEIKLVLISPRDVILPDCGYFIEPPGMELLELVLAPVLLVAPVLVVLPWVAIAAAALGIHRIAKRFNVYPAALGIALVIIAMLYALSRAFRRGESIPGTLLSFIVFGVDMVFLELFDECVITPGVLLYATGNSRSIGIDIMRVIGVEIKDIIEKTREMSIGEWLRKRWKFKRIGPDTTLIIIFITLVVMLAIVEEFGDAELKASVSAGYSLFANVVSYVFMFSSKLSWLSILGIIGVCLLSIAYAFTDNIYPDMLRVLVRSAIIAGILGAVAAFTPAITSFSVPTRFLIGLGVGFAVGFIFEFITTVFISTIVKWFIEAIL